MMADLTIDPRDRAYVPSDNLMKTVPRALDFAKGPLERQALELYFTQKTMARPIIAAPGLPTERVQLLRKAFAELASDGAFLADADRSKVEVNLLDGSAVDKVVALITSSPQEVRNRYAKAANAREQ